MSSSGRLACLALLALASCERSTEPASNKSPLQQVDQILSDVENGKLPTPVATEEEPVEGETPQENPPSEQDPANPPVVKPEVPVAMPVPDKPGFVVSPYSGKWVDVTEAKPGEIVADPHAAGDEPKVFRVPEFELPEPEALEEAEEEPAAEAGAAEGE